MSFSTAGAQNALKGFLGQTGAPILFRCYMGLSTTTPSSDGSNFTEPDAAAGYARALIGIDGQSGTQLMEVEGASAANDQIIFFPEATSTWGTVTYFGLFSAASGGVPLIYGALSSSVSVPANYVPLFRVGSFTLSLQ